MPVPARTELKGDPPWLASLLDATAKGTALYKWSKKKGNPSTPTVYAWFKDREDIAQRFAHARKCGANHVVDEVVTVAHGPVDDQGEYDPTQDTSVRVARDKLRVDTLRWLAGIWDPERLGSAAHKIGAGSVNITVVTGVPPSTAESPARLTVEEVERTQLPADTGHTDDPE